MMEHGGSFPECMPRRLPLPVEAHHEDMRWRYTMSLGRSAFRTTSPSNVRCACAASKDLILPNHVIILNLGGYLEKFAEPPCFQHFAPPIYLIRLHPSDRLMATVMLGRCAMRAASVTRRARLSPATMFGGSCCRELSASSNLSTKQRLDGFTVKDSRAPRPRVAKEKRKKYLAERKASFEAEQEKATSLGLDWGVRSAL